MAFLTEIEIPRLKEVFDADFDKGVLYWKVKLAYRVKVGSVAGTKRPTGHLIVQIFGKDIYVHRILWAMYHNEWPTGFLDHINRNPSDNRIANLRIATKQQNAANIDKPSKNNKLGVKGVSIHAKTKKYRATISDNGKMIHLGLFTDIENARMAYVAASNRIHGEHSPYLT